MTYEKEQREIYEKLGWCWHETKNNRCTCNGELLDSYALTALESIEAKERHHNPDLTTWEGFGKLWEEMEARTEDTEKYDEKFDGFWFKLQQKSLSIGYDVGVIPRKEINPTRFMLAVHEWLKEQP